MMTAVPRSEITTNPTGGFGKNSGKIYVAGISWDSDDAALKSYFARLGNVQSAAIQRDRQTGKSRGFGFVTFEDPATADKVVNMKLEWNGRILELKPAAPRGLVQEFELKRKWQQDRPKKIFVAGLPKNITSDDLKDYFSQFGSITECYVQKDRNSGESRGFAFVTFDSGDAVDKVLAAPHRIGEKTIDCKIARPKDVPIAGVAAGLGAGLSGLGSLGGISALGAGLGGLGGLGQLASLGRGNSGASAYGSAYGGYGDPYAASRSRYGGNQGVTAGGARDGYSSYGGYDQISYNPYNSPSLAGGSVPPVGGVGVGGQTPYGDQAGGYWQADDRSKWQSSGYDSGYSYGAVRGQRGGGGVAPSASRRLHPYSR
jgi:heterogeneous nuclear ribonucleoprotein A1/A3